MTENVRNFLLIYLFGRFENDRTISFIPPDGEFELMSYRLNTHVKPLIWIESVIERHAHSRSVTFCFIFVVLFIGTLFHFVLFIGKIPEVF